MSFPLDHVVIAVGDLDRTAADYEALGFTVTRGGSHPGRTSRNALVCFADGSYLELIAWAAAEPVERWHKLQAAHGDGLVDFALLPPGSVPGQTTCPAGQNEWSVPGQTPDPSGVGAAVQAARARGLELDGPQEGGRVRPDGERLAWRTARQRTFDLPFLCGDVTPRERRVPGGDAARHRNGVTGVAAVSVAVRDAAASAARYAALLGQAAAGPSVVAGTGIRVASVRAGPCDVALLQPLHDEPVAGEGEAVAALRQRLATRGEGPHALVLAAPGPVRLDARMTHGVAMDVIAAG